MPPKQYAVKPLFLMPTPLLAAICGYRYPDQFSELITELIGQDCPLTTVEMVRLEFLSKNRSPEELSKKIQFYEATLTYPELPARTFESELREPSLLFTFGRQCQNFKAVDYTLAAAIKKYSSMSVLLTNDHHDFTLHLFDLVALLPFTPSEGGMVPFGLYAFSEDKYTSLLIQT